MAASSRIMTVRRMLHPRSWIAPGVLLLLAAGFVSLGRWQLERAEVNRETEQRFERTDSLPVLDDPTVSDAELHRYRRIRLAGRYEPGVQVLLDNRTRDGRAGYEVLTPFLVDGFARRVIVNRGWVPASWDRAELPDVEVHDDATTVHGRVDRLPRAGLTLGDSAAPADRAVVVMSYPDVAELQSVLGLELFAFQLLLDPDSGPGFARDWTVPQDRDERNLGYAVQWFGLAALALVLAVGIAARGWQGQQAAS